MITIRTKEEVMAEQKALADWRDAVKALAELCIAEGIEDEAAAASKHFAELEAAKAKAAAAKRSFDFAKELKAAKAAKEHEAEMKKREEADKEAK
jgi:hypothetical protein